MDVVKIAEDGTVTITHPGTDGFKVSDDGETLTLNGQNAMEIYLRWSNAITAVASHALNIV